MILQKEILKIIDLAIKEDLGAGDITTAATLNPSEKGKGRIISKATGIVAGTGAAAHLFKKIDKRLRIRTCIKDGRQVKRGSCIMEITGPMAGILKGERTALNFLQHLSGIATRTSTYVEKVKGLKAAIIDTRKTLPGMRLLVKQAVKAGGGGNHRQGLYDMFLVKDNHIDRAGGIPEALKRVAAWKKRNKNRARVEVETRNLREVKQALAFKPDWIMLDNMPPWQMQKAVSIIRKAAPKIKIEASGNISLKNVRAAACTGVDLISIGALTHSVKALDMSLLAT